jgi:BNR repeat-containing family member
MVIPQTVTGMNLAINLVTSGSYQFAVWYDLAGELRVGRIQRGVHRWGVGHTEYTFGGTPRTALSLPVTADEHNFPAIAVINDRLHVWANMHIEPLMYVRTTAAHTTDGWLANGGWVDAAPEIPDVDVRFTYPTPVPRPDGTVWFYGRNGGSGSASGRSNSYYWVHNGTSWSARTLLFQGVSVPDAGGPGIPGTGEGAEDITNFNAYVTNFFVEGTSTPYPGRMHVSWVWRHTGTGSQDDGEENVLPSYGYSDDGGITWKAADGTPLTVPMTPLNNVAARTPGSALVRSISRTGNVVTADLDWTTPDHGIGVGDVITVVVQDAGYNGVAAFTVASVGNPTPNSITWAQTAADDVSGGVGSITKYQYQNWGGITVDDQGRPHIVGSVNPKRYIRRNSTNTGWLESQVTGTFSGLIHTSRCIPFWIRGQLWILAISTPAVSRRIRLFRITGSDHPIVTMSGDVGDTGDFEPSHDPEAWRRFRTIEVLVPDGNVPNVFVYGGARARILAA